MGIVLNTAADGPSKFLRFISSAIGSATNKDKMIASMVET